MTVYFTLGHARIACLSKAEAIAQILDLATAAKASYVVTPNADHIVMLEENEELRRAYAGAQLVLADGMPVVWASRLIGPTLPERVTGAELMPLLCAEASLRQLRVYFLGAAPGVAERAKRALEAQYPDLQVVGTYSPPLGFEKDPLQNQQVIERLRFARPHLIFVGLGAPKQELWMASNASLLGSGVFLGIGAAIDFCAGQVRRAPLWMQKGGLEWLFRLLQEPKRLAKRYLRDTRILAVIWRQWRQNR